MNEPSNLLEAETERRVAATQGPIISVISLAGDQEPHSNGGERPPGECTRGSLAIIHRRKEEDSVRQIRHIKPGRRPRRSSEVHAPASPPREAEPDSRPPLQNWKKRHKPRCNYS